MTAASALLASILIAAAPPAHAGDREALVAMLDDFLAHADEKAAHERFWADDLVYTSSDGTRTDKAEILKSFEAPGGSEEPPQTYRAEDVQVKLYGSTAVVAFTLVGTSMGDDREPRVRRYFNTGTFLKRSGEWQVVAWQATHAAE